MKCPRCGLVTFDHLPACPRCDLSFTLVRPLTRSLGGGHPLRDDPELRGELRDRLHRARLARRRHQRNPMADGNEPDAPEWFLPRSDVDDGAPPPAADPPDEAGRGSEEEAMAPSEPDTEEARNAGQVSVDDGGNGDREDEDGPSGKLPFGSDGPGFMDWREELRERLKHIRSRKREDRDGAAGRAAAKPPTVRKEGPPPGKTVQEETAARQEGATRPNAVVTREASAPPPPPVDGDPMESADQETPADTAAPGGQPAGSATEETPVAGSEAGETELASLHGAPAAAPPPDGAQAGTQEDETQAGTPEDEERADETGDGPVPTATAGDAIDASPSTPATEAPAEDALRGSPSFAATDSGVIDLASRRDRREREQAGAHPGHEVPEGAGDADDTPQETAASATDNAPEEAGAGAADDAPEVAGASAADDTPQETTAHAADRIPDDAGAADRTPAGAAASSGEETPEEPGADAADVTDETLAVTPADTETTAGDGAADGTGPSASTAGGDGEDETPEARLSDDTWVEPAASATAGDSGGTAARDADEASDDSPEQAASEAGTAPEQATSEAGTAPEQAASEAGTASEDAAPQETADPPGRAPEGSGRDAPSRRRRPPTLDDLLSAAEKRFPPSGSASDGERPDTASDDASPTEDSTADRETSAPATTTPGKADRPAGRSRPATRSSPPARREVDDLDLTPDAGARQGAGRPPRRSGADAHREVAASLEDATLIIGPAAGSGDDPATGTAPRKEAARHGDADAPEVPDFDVDAADADAAEGPAWETAAGDDEIPVPASSALAPSAGPMNERAAAAACDALVLVAIAGCLVAAAGSATGLGFAGALQMAPGMLALTWSIFAVGYALFFNTTCGQTVGKMVMRLRLVSDEQFSVRLPTAGRRLAGTMLTVLTLGLGALIALRDPRRRTLHDRLSGTRVVKA